MDADRTPKEVVERFLRDGSRNGQWDMDVIGECFDDDYWSHTWQGDLAHTGREVEIDHIEMWRVRDGKIVEHWGGTGVAGQLYRALTAVEGAPAERPAT